MSVKGWFPDPSGRFGQRWYDGHRWSDQVVAANGSTIDDPLPETDRPYPPPMPTQVVPPAPAPAAPPAAAWPAAAPGFGPRPAVPPRPAPLPAPGGPERRLRPGATFGIGLFGLLITALSLFGVSWVSDGPGANFFDISEAARDASGDGELVVRAYGAAGGFVLFVVALGTVVLAGLPAPSRPAAVTVLRVAATGVCGVAAVLHTLTVVRIFRGPASPEIGAWLGTVGYFIAIVGLVIGHYRRSRPA